MCDERVRNRVNCHVVFNELDDKIEIRLVGYDDKNTLICIRYKYIHLQDHQSESNVYRQILTATEELLNKYFYVIR